MLAAGDGKYDRPQVRARGRVRAAQDRRRSHEPLNLDDAPIAELNTCSSQPADSFGQLGAHLPEIEPVGSLGQGIQVRDAARWRRPRLGVPARFQQGLEHFVGQGLDEHAEQEAISDSDARATAPRTLSVTPSTARSPSLSLGSMVTARPS
ncbi:MAG TPA: hypothetical protein VI197_18485 [Polyangiaceae bacterium]